MDLDKGEMLLPRLFQQSETGRGALKDFTKFNLIRPANQEGLIPWVNDYIPEWKRNELLQMVQTGQKVAVGFRRINLTMLPPEQCRIVAASRCVRDPWQTQSTVLVRDSTNPQFSELGQSLYGWAMTGRV